MSRLIEADKLKAHYSWWKGGGREMTMDEAKNDFDTIVDLQPTVEVEPIEVRAAYEQKAYNKGYADGYAMCLMDFNAEETIVRCKDCKHWDGETHGCEKHPSAEPWWETDSCNYGERKDRVEE